jgi:hypothetical protein
MLCMRSQLLSLSNKLEGKSRWKVARMGGKVTMKATMWGKDKILDHWFEDSPSWQHFPMIDQYWNCMCFPICNERTRIVPPTFDVEVVGLKPCNLNDILHILKELKYTLLIIPHLERYYFIYHLQTCLLVGFVPPMLNAKIIIEDFERMWKI